MAPTRTAADPADDLLAPGEVVDETNCHREPIRTPGAVQAHGVLLAARQADGIVVQASANAAAFFDAPLDAVLGARLDALLGPRLAADLGQRAADAGAPNLRPIHDTVASHAVDAFAHRPVPALLVVELEHTGDHGRPSFERFQDDVAGALAAVQDAPGVEELLTTAARVVSGLTAFDRVWVYRFEADDHGVIVAEEKVDGLPAFLGLHYPAADIPPQARALFVENRLRLIGDVEAEQVALVPLINPVTGKWLDLSGSVLRAVSPVHVRYLRNMAATASMSVALTVRGRLWGLISAHHYEGPRRVSHQARAACELVGLLCSMQLAALDALESTQRSVALERHQVAVLERVTAAETVVDGLLDAGADLLGVCGADGVAVRIAGRLECYGDVPASREGIGRLIDDVCAGTGAEILAADALRAELPQHADLEGAAGVLVVPLSRAQGNAIAWFRRGWVQTVTWGSSQAPVRDAERGGTRLDPEGSFAAWTESVEGRSRPWEDVEVAAAERLRAALGTFVLARAEQLSALNAALSSANAELDAFAYVAAHDLKEPLRGIGNYATFLAEDYHEALDEAGREQLAAVMRLVERMGGLLDALLDYARVGQVALVQDEVRLDDLVADASELLAGRLERPGVALEVIGGRLHGDRERLGHLLTNLLSNALKYGVGETSRLEVGLCAPADTRRGEALLAGQPFAQYDVVRVRDDGMGIAPEHREAIFSVFRRLHGPGGHGGGSGVGLSIARRIAERHGGLLWLDESVPGAGSSFCFAVPRP